MIHLNTFFNTRDVYINNAIELLTVAVGDLCFTPIRYLFKGDYLEIEYPGTDKERIAHQSEIPSFRKRPVLKVVAAIIFLFPLAIMGTLFKGIGYLNPITRQKHQLIVLHYTPLEVTIGSPDKLLTKKEINQELNLIHKDQYNHLNRKIGKLILYWQDYEKNINSLNIFNERAQVEIRTC